MITNNYLVIQLKSHPTQIRNIHNHNHHQHDDQVKPINTQVKEGDRVELSCPSPHPWFLCIWRSPAKVGFRHQDHLLYTESPKKSPILMLDHEYGFAVLEGDFINLLMALSTNGHILGASVWDPAKSNGLSVSLQQHQVLQLPFWKWTLLRNTASTDIFRSIFQTLPRLTLSGNSTDCKVTVTISRRE